jgi:uncharacterized protein (TIGR02453 family)
MNPPSGFSGFSRDTVRFFEELKENNNKVWFESHRDLYEDAVMAPARSFIETMGVRLRTIAPKLLAVPKVNKSLFRLNRDTRFSLDPTPYKTNLGIIFWEGTRPRMECPGFYFHLEPPEAYLGGGYYYFGDRALVRYRKAVTDPKLGQELAAITAEIRTRKGWEIGGSHYKRVPRGFDATHPNAELLKHHGLYAGWGGKVPKEFYGPGLIEFCFEKYAKILPLHRWLMKVFG